MPHFSLRRRLIVEAAIVTLMALAGFGYFTSTQDLNVNSRLALVKAIVEEKRFEIDSYHAAEAALPTVDKAFHNGHYYSDKAIGSSVLGAIVYYPLFWLTAKAGIVLKIKIFRELLTFFAISLPCVVMGVLLYLSARKLSGSAGWSLAVTAAICFGTPFYKYATAYYSHSLAGALFFGAFYIWLAAKEAQQIRPGWIFLSGFLMGFTFITEYPTALLLLALAPYIFYVLTRLQRARDWRVYALLAGGCAIPLAALLFYNYRCFGNPFTLGYSQLAEAGFREAHAAGLLGIGLPDLRIAFYMTFHPSVGVFWQAPILVFSLWGWVVMLRDANMRAEGMFTLAAAFVFIGLISGYYMWWGGGVYTPRHLIPILPLFALPLAVVPRKIFPVALILLLVSIFQNFLATAGGYGLFQAFYDKTLTGKYVTAFRGMSIYEVYWPNILSGNLTSNRGMQWFDLKGVESFWPLLVFELAVVAVFLAFARSDLRAQPGTSGPEATTSER